MQTGYADETKVSIAKKKTILLKPTKRFTPKKVPTAILRKKFIAYDAMTNDFEYFKTPEEAKEWILDQDWSEGFPPEFTDGAYFIAEITHISAFRETDKKENYPCIKTPAETAYCSYCDDYDDCESEGHEWPYSRHLDFVGEPYMVSVSEATTNKIDN